MQARKNKYQQDNRGYIIENTKEKETTNSKGKDKAEAVSTKNKFNAMVVKENAQPILTMMDAKVDDNGKNKVKESAFKDVIKVQDQAKKKKDGGHNGNHKSIGIKEGESAKDLEKVKESTLINKDSKAHNVVNASLNKEVFDARHIKKEAVKAANKEREAALKEIKLNPTPVGIQSPATKGVLEVPKETTPSSIDASCEEELDEYNEMNSKKELWSDEVEIMEDQLATTNATGDNEKRSNKQVQKTANFEGATVNPSSPNTRVLDNSSSKVDQSIPSVGGDRGKVMEPGNQRALAIVSLANDQANGTVKPSASRDVLAYVDGVPVYALRDEQVGDVDMEENLGNMKSNSERKEVALRPQELVEHAIATREPGELVTLPMACASDTGSPMQIQVNVPLKSPNQILHDIITHKELPIDMQDALVDQH
ncbi:hypothetical protein A4A49_10545 [Nicotiana attenuata]|uniref:Uncharacterized protein n=1 Tax=Nicotiana attenuata TaxID=49451 RepID=A0A314LCW2_NICAT|nr:hypothetical protein A4A49_10545 [Nicotiana attenuata]